MARKFLISNCLAISIVGVCMAAETGSSSAYDDLLQLFADWREFEQPPMLAGAPDYTVETFDSRYKDLQEYRVRL
jgi:hypothetical protein